MGPARATLGRGALAGAVLAMLAGPAVAQTGGMATVPSAHPMRATLDRFAAAVREAGWVVFHEVDHAAAARDVGMSLRGRTVVLFGNPRAGTPGMAANPTLALDLPMRVLVWEDNDGRTQVTRSTGDDLAERVFARHSVAVPPEGRRMTEALLDRLVRQAVQ
jgi:uncharacterized protein (DUF302 family)